MKSGSLASLVGVAAAVTLSLFGCGPDDPPGTIVKGRLVQDGTPILAPRADVGVGLVEMELSPVGPPEGGTGARTSAGADGSFVFVGPGSGVPAGEYDLILFKRDEKTDADYFLGKFAKGKTPIKVTVPAEGGEHDLGDIDVAKY